MWTSTPFFIQEQMVDEIYTKKPTFILYKSDSDIFYNSDKSLKIVNNFIKKNYSFSEKYSYWEIFGDSNISSIDKLVEFIELGKGISSNLARKFTEELDF